MPLTPDSEAEAEAEAAGGSVPGQPELHKTETLSHLKKKKERKKDPLFLFLSVFNLTWFLFEKILLKKSE